MNWNLSPPSSSIRKDHDVVLTGNHLSGKRIALLITGSIAAYRTPDLVRSFRREGADVVVFITSEGLRYVTQESLEWTSLHPVVAEFTPNAEHLSDQHPFDAYVVAPATYSVINKMALGIADSVVTTTLASALGRLEYQKIPLLVAPTMHGSMHHSILMESLKKLEKLGVTVIAPRQENGKDNLPDGEVIVAETIRALSQSALKGKRLLVTGGPTPVWIDRIRYITTRFTGELAIEIGKEAYFHGANPQLILGRGSKIPPSYLPVIWVQSYQEYLKEVEQQVALDPSQIGIFSAAVADYQPESFFDGKLPSQKKIQNLPLIPTEKVIQRLQKKFPELFMVTFKYEESISHEALMKLARDRLKGGHRMVVANRGEETGPQGQQVAWLVGTTGVEQRAEGKQTIASRLMEHLQTEFVPHPH